MLDEDIEAFLDGQRREGGIRTAVLAWCNDPAAAKQLYGPIASWNTSEASAPATQRGQLSSHLCPHCTRR